MLNKISNKLATHLAKNKIIQCDEISLYVYGFELLISFLFSTLTIIVFGIIFNFITETVVFLLVFILLRSYSGGYHALTYSFCTCVTLIVYATTVLLSHCLTITREFFFVLIVAGIVILSIFAPVKNPNKEISVKRTLEYKIISIIIFCIFSICGIVLFETQPIISNSIFYTLCADLLLIFPKNHKIHLERRARNDEYH